MGARDRSIGWVVASAGVGLMMLALAGCSHQSEEASASRSSPGSKGPTTVAEAKNAWAD